jgi:hypothetical protein
LLNSRSLPGSPARVFIAALLGGAALLAPSAARALEPLVRVTACDPVQVGGHDAQRLTLAIAGQFQFYDTVGLWPVVAAGNDTCSIVDFTPPPGWKTFRGDLGSVFFYGAPVALGQSLDGFQITVNDVGCCFEVNLSNFLLLDSPGYGVACFHDCAVTPTNLPSWGRLKVLYR